MKEKAEAVIRSNKECTAGNPADCKLCPSQL